MVLDNGVVTGVFLVVIESILHRALLVPLQRAFPGSFVTAGSLSFADGVPAIIGQVSSDVGHCSGKTTMKRPQTEFFDDKPQRSANRGGRRRI
jgi:hypothetical protein